MKNISRFLAVCVLAVWSFVAIPVVAQKTPTAPQPLPVNVENTPNVNVANTPSVSVSNTPNVNVTNTPSVSVTNTPSVNVANTPSVTLEAGASVAVTSPLDGQGNPTPIAVLDAFQPYEDFCILFFDGGSGGECSFQTIPSDKLLVIQEFDSNAALESGLKASYVAVITGFYSHAFTETYMGSQLGFDFFADHQDTRMYVRPGVTPGCEIVLTGNSASGDYVCDLSGFLVDAPLAGSGAASPAQHGQRQPLPFGRNYGRHPNN